MSDIHLPNLSELAIMSEELDELANFESQEKVPLAFEKREGDLDLKLEQPSVDHDVEAQKLEEEDLINLLDQANLQVVNEAIPACTFTKFPELPTEIKCLIWSLASRLNAPQDNYFFRIDSGLQERSYISSKAGDGSYAIVPTYPPLLSVCQLSRSIAQNFYACMACVELERNGSMYQRLGYINTFCDNFYIFGYDWNDYRVLTNMFLTARARSGPLITNDIRWKDTFAEIHHLHVELCLFARAPCLLWTQFRRLDTLTICFYPHKGPHGAEREIVGRRSYMALVHFVCPPPSSLFGKRAAWLRELVTISFNSTQRKFVNCSHWRVPQIKVSTIIGPRHFKEMPVGWEEISGDIEEEVIIEDSELESLSDIGMILWQQGFKAPIVDVTWYRTVLRVWKVGSDMEALKRLRRQLQDQNDILESCSN